MSDDDHPIISNLREYATDPADSSLDAIAAGFAKLDDFQRVNTLQKMRSWLDEEETPSRKTSQLMDLTRKMTAVHERLRRVGR